MVKMMVRKTMVFCLVLVIALLIVGCGGAKTAAKKVDTKGPVADNGNASSAKTHTVVIVNNKFNPVDLSVKARDTVQWINRDNVKHTVTFEDARVDVVLPNKGMVKHTFKSKEEARYFCKIHSGMRGSVKVG